MAQEPSANPNGIMVSALGAIDWAFDKLRCVKGDIKVLIYEVSEQPNGSQPPDTVAKLSRAISRI
jgi:hypothetical protein